MVSKNTAYPFSVLGNNAYLVKGCDRMICKFMNVITKPSLPSLWTQGPEVSENGV